MDKFLKIKYKNLAIFSFISPHPPLWWGKNLQNHFKFEFWISIFDQKIPWIERLDGTYTAV
jgi:hypothetical protein